MKISRKVQTLLLVSLSTFSAGLFILLWTEIREASQGLPELIGRLDSYFVEFSRAIRFGHLTKVAIAITELGSATILTIFVLVAAMFFGLRRQIRSALLLLVAGFSAAILPLILKSHYVRPRPDAAFHLVEVDGFSFPSGHALASTTVYATLALLIIQGLRRRSERCLMAIVATLLILGIGLSRIYLGVHYFSDVLGGTCIGVSVASLLAAISRYSREHKGEIHGE